MYDASAVYMVADWQRASQQKLVQLIVQLILIKPFRGRFFCYLLLLLLSSFILHVAKLWAGDDVVVIWVIYDKHVLRKNKRQRVCG